jgi:hypothetical protein
MSRCKKCEGTGVMNRNLTPDCYITCSDCHGTGEIPVVRENRTSEPLINSEQLVKPEMPERRIEMDIKIAREIAARIWCDQEMRSVEMDSTLCERIAQLLAGSASPSSGRR